MIISLGDELLKYIPLAVTLLLKECKVTDNLVVVVWLFMNFVKVIDSLVMYSRFAITILSHNYHNPFFTIL